MGWLVVLFWGGIVAGYATLDDYKQNPPPCVETAQRQCLEPEDQIPDQVEPGSQIEEEP
jgi:hypothetical protein